MKNLIEAAEAVTKEVEALKTKVNNVTITPLVYNGKITFTISQDVDKFANHLQYLRDLTVADLKEINTAISNILIKLEKENA